MLLVAPRKPLIIITYHLLLLLSTLSSSQAYTYRLIPSPALPPVTVPDAPSPNPLTDPPNRLDSPFPDGGLLWVSASHHPFSSRALAVKTQVSVAIRTGRASRASLVVRRLTYCKPSFDVVPRKATRGRFAVEYTQPRRLDPLR